MSALVERQRAGLVVANAPWPKVSLHSIARHHSGNSKLIKGTLHDEPAVNLFPAFSATGQDVWRDGFDREGDAIIISAVGARCGKCFIARGRWSAIANTHVVWPDPEQVDLKFLWYLLNDEHFWIRSGSAQPFVAVRKTFEKEILLPPLPEQRRIVAEIEKQFTRLDAGIAALRRVQVNLKRYRAAALKAACEGQLVRTEAELARKEALFGGSIPRKAREAGSTPAALHGVQKVVSSGLTSPTNRAAGSNLCGPIAAGTLGVRGSTPSASTRFETGEQLLARILTARRQNWTGRGQYKEPITPDTNQLPLLPDGWAVASIDQISGHVTSGSRDWSQYYDKGTGTFILAQNVRPMRLDLRERQSVDAPKGDAETDRTRVQRNDILVTIVGAKTGDVCRISGDLEDHFVCQSVALLRPVLSGLSKFVEIYLASQENGQAQWKRYIYGQGRPHLSFEQLRMTAVPLPPLTEQKRIVAELERRLSVVEELETVVSANLQRASSLRQSVLQKAFAGGLV